MRWWVAIAVAVALALSFTASARADTVRVSLSGSDSAGCGTVEDPCETLRYAVGVAADGDVISLAAGTFPVTSSVEIRKSLTIRGAGEDDTTLDGEHANTYATDGLLRLRTSTTSDAEYTIEDLTITRPGRRAASTVRFGVFAQPSNFAQRTVDLTVTDVTFTGSTQPAATDSETAVDSDGNRGRVLIEDVTTTDVPGNVLQFGRQVGPLTVRDSRIDVADDRTAAAVYQYSWGGPTYDVTGDQTYENNVISGATALRITAGFEPVPAYAPSAIIGTVTLAGNTVRSRTGGRYGLSVANVSNAADGANGRIADLQITDNVLTGAGPGDGISVTGLVTHTLITTNSVRGFARGVVLGPRNDTITHAPADANVNANQLVGNGAAAGTRVGLQATATSGVSATGNWWGCNSGPMTVTADTIADAAASNCDAIVAPAGAVNAATWLQLRIDATPAVLADTETATVDAGLGRDNTGADAANAFPDDPPVALTASGGIVEPVSPALSGAVASAVFTSTAAAGRLVTATFDRQSLTYTWENVPPGASQSQLERDRGREVLPDPLPSCARHVAITNLTSDGRRVTLSGLARTAYSGERVFVSFRPTGGRVVATPTVNPDGTWTATVTRPAEPNPTSNLARYTAAIAGQTSRAIKVTRRLTSSTIGFGSGRLQIRGRVSTPLMAGARVQVAEGDYCGRYTTIGSLRLGANGRFSGQIAPRTNARATFVRLRVNVRSARGRTTVTTFSIVTRVALRGS